MNEQRDRRRLEQALRRRAEQPFAQQIGDDQADGLAVGGIEGRVDAGEDEIVAIAVGAYMEKKFGGAEMSLMVDLAGKSMTLRGNKKLRGG